MTAYDLPMESLLLQYEGVVRLGMFLAIFLVMALWEMRAPKRVLSASKQARWTTNWLFVLIDAAIVRVLLVLTGLLGAWDAAVRGVGLFHWLGWPSWLEVVLCIIILDCVIYWQHVLSHRVPLFWRFHKVHHTDRDFDVTSAVRFHPVEIGASMLLKLAAVYLLGAPALAVVLFEIILNGCAVFNHSNIALPGPVDRIVRLLLVTPDMHRVHHSSIPGETNSNFGFNVPWWDRLFGTYIAQPSGGHEGMQIGLEEHQGEEPTKLIWSLALPFRSVPPGR